MKVLVDVNLPPAWTQFLAAHHIEAVHWTAVGNPRATDEDVMRYAREHGYLVFTHDLDFGALLVFTKARGPSVLQVRTQNVLPEAIGDLVVGVLTEHASSFDAGALVTLDQRQARVRILPVR